MDSLIASFCLMFGCATAVATPNVNSYTSMPKGGQPYYEELTRIASNPSREAAQTQQESGWNPKARSPYAKGLRQFTPSTGKWASKTFCRSLGAYRPYDGLWSLRCGVLYMSWLEKRVSKKYPKAPYWFIRKVAEQMYNGGGRVLTELSRSGGLSLSKARGYCRRARWACKENYSYPKYITKHQPRYKSLGGVIIK